MAQLQQTASIIPLLQRAYHNALRVRNASTHLCYTECGALLMTYDGYTEQQLTALATAVSSFMEWLTIVEANEAVMSVLVSTQEEENE